MNYEAYDEHEFDFVHCPVCGSELLDGEMEIEVEGEKQYIKGFYCAACENQPQEIIDYNEDQAQRKYRHTHGILMPETIKNIRESLYVEAEDLSKLMGYPADYYSFWEHGTVMPTKAQSNFIRLMRRGQNFAFLAALYSDVKAKEALKRKFPKENTDDIFETVLMYNEEDPF